MVVRCSVDVGELGVLLVGSDDHATREGCLTRRLGRIRSHIGHPHGHPQLEAVGELLPHHHVAAVDLVTLGARTIVHGAHGIVDQAHDAIVDGLLAVVGRGCVVHTLQRLRHGDRAPCIRQHLVRPSLQNLGHGNLVAIAAVSRHVIRRVGVLVDDGLQVLEGTGIEVTPAGVAHFGTELVAALVGVLVGGPVLGELHAATAAPEGVVHLIHDALLGSGQEEARGDGSRLVRVGVQVLEILGAPREGDCDGEAGEKEDVLVHVLVFSCLGGIRG